MDGIALERWWPLFGAVAATLVWWLATGRAFPASADSLMGTTATVASVFASFLGVAKAILLTIKDSEVYKALARHGYVADMFGYIRTGVFASVGFAVLSIIGFFVSPTAAVWDFRVIDLFATIWVFAGCLTFFTYLRVSNILFKLLKQT